MAMRPDQVLHAAALPYVDWIQPFLPEYKYNASSPEAGETKHIYVESLIGDQQACRDDLSRYGASVISTFNDGTWYNVRLSNRSFESIAALWWVLYVETGTETSY
jgi:hypothetical protein